MKKQFRACRISAGAEHYVKRLPRSVADYSYTTEPRKALKLSPEQAARFSNYCRAVADVAIIQEV